MNKDGNDQESMRSLIRDYACQVVLSQDVTARYLGLTASDMKCWRVIDSYGPMTPSELVRRTGFTSGGITKIVDHLAEYGAVRRRFEQDDRRSLVIEALDPDKDALRDPLLDFDALVDEMTHRYSEAEAAVIRDFLKHGANTLEVFSDQLQAKEKY